MEEFFSNLAKFFGGIAGDQNTNAGLSVHKADDADSNFDDEAIAVPFTYRSVDAQDNGINELGVRNKNGSYRSGMLFIPSYAKRDIEKKDFSDNRGTVSAYGAELDDGTKLSYEQTVRFLNSLGKDNEFRISRHALGDNSDLTYDFDEDSYYPTGMKTFSHGKTNPRVARDMWKNRNDFTNNLRRILADMNEGNAASRESTFDQDEPPFWRALRGDKDDYSDGRGKIENVYEFIKNYRGL